MKLCRRTARGSEQAENASQTASSIQGNGPPTTLYCKNIAHAGDSRQIARSRSGQYVGTNLRMKSPDGATKSSWYDAVQVPAYPRPPAGGLQAGVCIVGAGIAGLTTAYL